MRRVSDIVREHEATDAEARAWRWPQPAITDLAEELAHAVGKERYLVKYLPAETDVWRIVAFDDGDGRRPLSSQDRFELLVRAEWTFDDRLRLSGIKDGVRIALPEAVNDVAQLMDHRHGRCVRLFEMGRTAREDMFVDVDYEWLRRQCPEGLTITEMEDVVLDTFGGVEGVRKAFEKREAQRVEVER